MNRKIFVSLVFVLCAVWGTSGQVPTDVHVKILKAEDARHWDTELEKLITGNSAEPVVVRAMLAAGRIGDERAVPVLSQRLKSGSPNIAAMAAFALGEIESIAGADAILQRIGETEAAQLPGGDDPTAVRGRLAEAAGKIAAANAKHEKAKDLGRAIVFVLAAEKQRQTSAETIRLALTAALRARPEGAEENVRPFLGHADPDVVADALNTVARLRAKSANREARGLLETNTNAVVRANAARVLGAAEDKDAVSLLIKAATSDTDSRVRVSAIRALASLKDQKAAAPLLQRGEVLLAAYRSRKTGDIPAEQNEFIEVATALGRILVEKPSERCFKRFDDFLVFDRMRTAELYTAGFQTCGSTRIRVDGVDIPRADWRYYSTMAQVYAAGANRKPQTDEDKRTREQISNLVQLGATGPKPDPKLVKAGPELLRAYAAFKTEDLEEVLRENLATEDVFLRSAAAELLAENFATPRTRMALENAFRKALGTDKRDSDAQLAMLDAMAKIDKAAALDTIYLALDAPDYLVRRKAFELLDDPELMQKYPGVVSVVQNARAQNKHLVWPYDVKTGTKLGQVLNTDADYRRALSRKNGRVKAVLATQKGVFAIDLLPEDAPLTVDNFVKLARSGYFNGLEVHRVVPNFVMQDGDPIGNGSGGPGWSIRCEINMVPYDRGAVGMALSGKDTGGSQWFVTHSPQPHLDGGYTVFGRVNGKDMGVVDRIVRGDKIVSVRIVEGGAPSRGAKRK